MAEFIVSPNIHILYGRQHQIAQGSHFDCFSIYFQILVASTCWKNQQLSSSMLLSEHVLKLVESYTNCGRNKTTENQHDTRNEIFGEKLHSLELSEEIKRITLNSQRKKGKHAPFFTLLYKSENYVLTIYKSTPNKRVSVLSTKHKFAKIDRSNKKCYQSLLNIITKQNLEMI